MLVIRSFINVKITEDGIAKACLWEHAFHCVLDDEYRFLFEKILYGSHALTTRITCVVYVNLLVHFVAGEDYFLGIDYDDIIATITVGSIACLPLSS